MPYTALYRKKRPKSFKDVVGQPHIVRALCNQLISRQVSHAYLFCGTRGTGKTSAAKILARAINCQMPTEGEPCNTCETCISILNERNLDVMEIDAASNNGVENIRDLREEVKYLPTQGKYKVYIVDEVHMLSTPAFNALLKTLEEPPAHVIFILATTDPQKIPDTILSRCQRYDFRRISAADMVETLKKYLQDENADFEESALEYIAYHSDGAMRDALSLLDQCLTLGGDGLSLDKVLEILGAVDKVRLFELTDALAEKNSGRVMQIINQAMDDGRDVSQFAADLIRHFRDVLVATLSENPNELDFSNEAAAKLKEQGSKISVQNLMEYIHAFSKTLQEMKFAPHMRTAFEVCALGVCMLPTAAAPQIVEAVQEAPPAAEKIKANTEPPPEKPPFKGGSLTPEILKEISLSWQKICQTLPVPLKNFCQNATVEVSGGILQLICDNEANIALIKNQQTKIREAIADKFRLDTPPNLSFAVKSNNNTKRPEAVSVTDSPPGAVSRHTKRPEAVSVTDSPPVSRQTEKTAIPPQLPPQEPEQYIPEDWASLGQATIGGDDESW